MTSKQVDCLCSPLRVQLYEAIRRHESASASELASAMGKSVHSLYYHLRALLDVGLIRVSERRRTGRREQAYYGAVSTKLVVDKNNGCRAYVEGLIKTVRIALRQAETEHRKARQSDLESEFIAILRIKASLSDTDSERLRLKIKELGNWVRNHDQGKTSETIREISLTCLATPIVDTLNSTSSRRK